MFRIDRKSIVNRSYNRTSYKRVHVECVVVKTANIAAKHCNGDIWIMHSKLGLVWQRHDGPEQNTMIRLKDIRRFENNFKSSGN